MTKSENPSMSVKELVVVIPAFASSLALCWEVGSFLPVGGAAFSYFTITEHISFALPALPFATLILITGFTGAIIGKRTPPTKKSRLALISSALFVCALTFAYIYRSATYAGLAISIALLLFCILFSASDSRRDAIAIGSLLSLVVLAITQGVDFTRGRLNKEELTDFNTSTGTIQAVTFRAGERGVLVYNRERHRFEFLRWDSIRTVDWGRMPIDINGSFGRLTFRE